jgi:hypothetical protein
MINNTTDINRTNNYLSPLTSHLLTEHKTRPRHVTLESRSGLGKKIVAIPIFRNIYVVFFVIRFGNTFWSFWLWIWSFWLWIWSFCLWIWSFCLWICNWCISLILCILNYENKDALNKLIYTHESTSMVCIWYIYSIPVLPPCYCSLYDLTIGTTMY